MALAGGIIYAWEIPKWFDWIRNNLQNPFARAFAAVVYFNPLWIMRHFLLVIMATEFHRLLVWDNYPVFFMTSVNSFFGAILVSVFCNYAIQNWITTERRFMASSIFSGFMAMYYALSKVWLERP